MKERTIHLVKSLSCHLLQKSNVDDIANGSFRVHAPQSEYCFIKEYENDIITSFRKNLSACFTKLNNSFFSSEESIATIVNLSNDILNDFESLSGLSLKELLIVARANALLNVYLCSVVAKLENEEYYKAVIKKIESKGSELYFRGQNDYSYDLLPSVYRNLKCDDRIIDSNFIFDKYKVYNQKFNYIFGNKKSNYEKWSFFQHTIAYSPFLDFTSSQEVATIFATSKYGVSVNSYSNNDAAVYLLIINEVYNFHTNVDTYIKKMNVTWRKNKIGLLDKINDKYLFAVDYTFFNVGFTFCGGNLNDRMSYQKGKFLFLYDCTIINGHILIPFDQISIFKLRIPKEIKEKCYDETVRKCPHYRYEYLMDPYLFFNQ